MTAQAMLLFTDDEKFNQTDYGLRVQTLPSANHVHILTLFFSQAVTVTAVQEKHYKLRLHIWFC